MALPSRNHTFPVSSTSSHHYHPPHHYRKKRGGAGTGNAGAASGTAAGPLRQLLVDREEEAGIMGGGSSRDASEEDNDAFSEHSDSASSAPRLLSETLGSPTQLPRGIPTTARDRALVDSKAHRHNYSNAFAGILAPGGQKGRVPNTDYTPSGASSGLRASQNPGMSTSGPIASSSVSGPSHQSGRKSFSTTGRVDPSVTATLSQAAAALSSSSSNDLSRYAADDEDKSSESSKTGRAASIDSNSTDDQIRPLALKRAAGGPLSLHSLPEPAAALSIVDASTPRPPNSANSLLASANLQREASTSSELDGDSESQSVASSLSHREGFKAPLNVRDGAGDEGDASDGGTASPYDGDVEFAARTPVSQQIVNQQISQLQQQASPSRNAGTTFAFDNSPASVLADLSPPADSLGSSNSLASDVGQSVKDVPCRVYTATAGPSVATGAPIGDGQTSDTSLPNAASASSTLTSQGTQHPSAAEIHSHLITLNPPHLVSRLFAHAAGVESSAIASSSSAPPALSTSFLASGSTSATASAQAPTVRIFVQTIFDVPTLATCTSLLRTAKMCLGPGLANQVRIVAGVVATAPPPPAPPLGETAPADMAATGSTLALEQRAGLARSCRWVDEVVEGVPYFRELDSSATLADAAGPSSSSSLTSTASSLQTRGDLNKLLKDVGAVWCARFVRGIEVEVTGSGRGGVPTTGDEQEGGLILLPRVV
ncbi:hypothetical protein BCV69DRAFT_182387 [Microstroma glucosiphilum]|uniref:Uncharacterized protein n=1 Tax=Pseudomicrostroma glucosiphilum TaxID=1684307 RepID=A0A316U705_9BASI|nr:hypothetical protein BCV69DRAFT_182387 [Pseudomicrostroma glucosiphilum]PWN21046.1 hypothetical protein BCV69DRAFT_182387 [Pseudomicrostroma glucosiphilum]